MERVLCMHISCFKRGHLFLSPAQIDRDPEEEIITYVLTIMNAVQLLFKQPSLGRQVIISVVLVDILKAQPKVSVTEAVAWSLRPCVLKWDSVYQLMRNLNSI